jgi:hypothetical protein
VLLQGAATGHDGQWPKAARRSAQKEAPIKGLCSPHVLSGGNPCRFANGQSAKWFRQSRLRQISVEQIEKALRYLYGDTISEPLPDRLVAPL